MRSCIILHSFLHRCGVALPMTGPRDGTIYEDCSQPATLRYGNTWVDCPTLQQAALAWDRLTADLQHKATIRINGGTVYAGAEIGRLHVGAPRER
jgi:hypothetical protein